MVTLKDIADACNISRATVSKALNGYTDVSPETVKQVQRVADEMGYLPNLTARALKTKKTYDLGILFSDELGSGFKHEYFTGILNSFKNAAEERGYCITFIHDKHGSGSGSTTYLEQCRYRNFEGVMIACTNYEDPQVLELARSGLPVVTTDYIFPGCSAAMSDNVGGMKSLMDYIVSLGHRRIAYIHGEMTMVTKQRLASFYQCCAAYGINQDEELVMSARFRDMESCAEATEQLMQMKNPPTCILYPDDFALVGGLKRLNQMGIRVPEDISIAGYDGSYLSEVLTPKLTTVSQDTEVLGRTAANQLIDAIEHPKTWLPEQITVPSRLIPGESVGRIN